MELALASYAFGLQCAAVIDRYLVTGGKQETGSRRTPAVLTLSKQEYDQQQAAEQSISKEHGAARVMDQVRPENMSVSPCQKLSDFCYGADDMQCDCCL